MDQLSSFDIRNKIVSEARTWIGTKFQHQGRTRSGVDCIGYLNEIRNNVFNLDEGLAKTYSLRVPPTMAVAELKRRLIKINKSEALPGDILLFRGLTNSVHLAILTDKGMIHSFMKFGKVVEHGFSAAWKRRLMGAFRFKELG